MEGIKVDHDLLIKINTNLENLTKDFYKIANGVGFPRCAVRGEKISIMEHNYLRLKDSLRWIHRTIIAIPVVYVMVEITKQIIFK